MAYRVVAFSPEYLSTLHNSSLSNRRWMGTAVSADSSIKYVAYTYTNMQVMACPELSRTHWRQNFTQKAVFQDQGDSFTYSDKHADR